MLGEPGPDEPDDPFPAYEEAVAEYTDPFPEYGEPDLEDLPGDVPKTLLRAFWRLVAVFNVGLLALALGPMLAFFRGEWVLGGVVTLVGAVAMGYGVHRYRHYRAQLRTGDLAGES